MSRPSGTYCFRERDVFLKGIRQHNTWKFYGEQTRDKILAYAVELTGTQGGTIRGNLYELDYQQHFRHVVEASQPVSVNRLFYEHGTRDIPDGQYFDGSPDRVLGNFLRYEAQPHDPAVLQEALRQEQHSRGRAVPGDFKAHVTALHDSRIETEARRIVDKLKDLSAPNSPNKTHFMVEISPHFDALASTKDNDRLFATGSYNQQQNYKVVYKTNLSEDYRTLADNLSTSKVYVLDARPAVLGLAANERVTEIMFVFGNVRAGFAQVETPYIYATARSGLANNSSIVNVADVGGLYDGQWIQAVSRWLTTVYAKTTVRLPKTGY